MKLKWFLILAPTLLIVGLLQSYSWVPTYESQTTGNPGRIREFIEASIGDAKILNPILNSDSASSRIAGLVFEGLLDLDENLNLRGRLATDWTIEEATYLLVNPKAHFPGGTPVTAPELERRIKKAMAKDGADEVKGLVTEVRLLPPENRTAKLTIAGKDGKPVPVEVRIQVPERLKFSLKRVDQDFFSRLQPILGADYEKALPLNKWIEVSPANKRESVRAQFPNLLPLLEHNPVILFHLRKGVRFHDNHRFDARDVKFTYEAIMNPKNLSPRTSDFEPIKSVEILDAYTVRVVYKRLFSPAINAWTIGILPEHLLNKEALQQEADRRRMSDTARKNFGMRDSEFNRHPVGTGPFSFIEWQSDELIHLKQNKDYWEGPPQYENYYYRVIPDPLTQEVEFRTGAVDAYSPLPHQVARYRRNDAYQSYSSLGFGFSYIGYNNRREIFKDRRVRQALGMAINVDEIIRYVLYGEGERTTGPYPKNTEWYDRSVKPVPYDPEGAQRIFRELGWKKNAEGWLERDGKIFEFNLVTNNGNLIRKAIMTIAQNNWRRIGVKCNTQLFEWAVFLQDFINTGDFDAVILGWSMGVDPDLYQIWHSSQSGPHQLNFVGYKNPKADALIVHIRREYNHAVQQKLAHRLHQVIAEDQPYTFLYEALGTQVLDKKIVMSNADGTYSKLKPTKSGNVFFYFNRWKKLEFAPTF
ncbi:MAG: ABC transporter substrate-binding protein [Candidatus Binatia bacterium]